MARTFAVLCLGASVASAGWLSHAFHEVASHFHSHPTTSEHHSSSQPTHSESHDYSNSGSFSHAFSEAHSKLGPGHTFTYHGKSYSTNTAADNAHHTSSVSPPQSHTVTQHEDTHHDYSSQGSFSSAFKAARTKLGPGHTFTYHGKSYSTNTAQENANGYHAPAKAPETETHTSTSSTVSTSPDTGSIAKACSAGLCGGALQGGVPASDKAAKSDSTRIEAMKSRIVAGAEKYNLPPSLVAGVISRESGAGRFLSSGGYGDHGHAYGVMQVDSRYHTQDTSGGPSGQSAIDQGCRILRNSINEVATDHPDWTHEQQVAGGVAAYNSGAHNIKTVAHMDKGTYNDDYSRDTMARAHYYEKSGIFSK